MIIKKIELQGFKSFPERTKIIFHPGITCIVGPNGTGKSNTVDALLWVLGGQRMKSQRAERSGDVIFNGNTKKPPLSMADVTLFLRDDEEELIISHRLFRSGESEYRLNGKSARLKDIQESLWKRDISEKEYFVIEQGQIGLFLSSKPTEKRLLLEEAAGTAYYKDKKKQAQNKLENSEQNLIRLEDIIDEVAKAKNSLKRQADAAVRYKKLREKIRRLKSLLYRKKIVLLEKNLREVMFRYEECLNRESAVISQLKSEEKNSAKKRTEVWELEKSIKEGQKNLFGQKSQLARSETDREREAKRTEFFEEKKKKAREDLEELKQEILQLEKEKAEAEENLKIFSQTHGQKQRALKEEEQANQESQEQVSSMGQNLKDLRNGYFQKLSEQTETENERIKLEKEKELTLRQEEKLRSQLREEQAQLQKVVERMEEQMKVLLQTQELKEAKKKTIESRQSLLADILAASESLQTRITELEGKKEEEIRQLQALEMLVKKERGVEVSQDIPGALGILADLIETDAEHAPLIDILWKEESKAALIHAQDFLKTLAEKELKGNFLLLSSQKREEIPSIVSEDPQFVGFFKSCLRPSPKIKDSFPCLEEAAIVRDMKSAVQIWLHFPSLNYITCEGDLLLSSGFIKLGKKEEGLFTLNQEIKRVKENITLINKQIEPFNIEHQEKMEQKQRLEEEIQKESDFLNQQGKKVEEIEKEKKYDKAERDKIKTHVDILENELGIFGKDRETLTGRIEALSLRAKTLTEEGNALKKRLEETEKEDETFQEKYEERKRHFFELKAGIELLQEKINNLNQHLQTQKQRTETLNAKIKSIQEEIRSCEEEQSHIKENIENLSKKTRSLEEEGKKQEAELALSESHLQKMKKEQEEMENKIEQLREEAETRKEERVRWEIGKAEAERDLVNLEEGCWQELKKSTREVKEEISEKEVKDVKIEENLINAEENLQKYKSVNLIAEEEYLIQKKRCDFLLQQKKDLRDSIDTTKEAILKIDQESKNQFLKGLAEVNKSLQDVFSILFNGGTAELRLVDSSQPLESGVEIIAQPPGKKVQSLSLLSGGEKSLTSLAFFFALFRCKPTPFCILDEVDAALDDVNLTKFLELMKKVKNETQFIIITHNVKTMEVADFIYGTTMAEPNITSLYSIQLEKQENSSKNI
jgi:chromosome segregation protein